MRKSRIQKVAIAFIAACALLGGIEATNAQMHDGSHAGGGAVHGGGSSHDGGVHSGGGMHHDDGHHGHGFRGPIIIAPGYYPYGYGYPYGDPAYGYSYPYADDSSSYQWYCRNPAGYWPDVQFCPSGWLQLVPNG